MLGTEIPQELTDAQVVAQSLVDRSYFALIVERYEDKLMRYIRRLGVSSHEDRQDILQEIFLKVYKNLNGFDSGLLFSSWIYRIAHNETISWYRKQNVRPEGHLISDNEELFLYIPDGGASAEQLVDEAIDAKRLRQALLVLDAKYRDPIILRFFEHKEYDEISDILKIPIGTVGTLISRGKMKLQMILTNEETTSTKQP
ncbi:RNA polymerase sigma factor [Patescibacteria group bacterium]|nr:RNA polymerase sigma factor [Patescibacteria group bacterium]